MKGCIEYVIPTIGVLSVLLGIGAFLSGDIGMAIILLGLFALIYMGQSSKNEEDNL